MAFLVNYYVLRAILPKFKNMIIFLLKIAAYTFHVGKYRMCHTETDFL